MQKIEHIGIAVNSLEKSIPLFEQLLGTLCYKKESVASENVNTAFFKTGESKIELIEGMVEGNVIQQFIEKRGEGIHHIAFSTDDIEAEIERLKSLGFEFIQDVPKKGADNKLICFLKPKCTNGILVELCQEISNQEIKQ
jgi:methylmalonyl-CoA/ethylmalonyl-CoA epimerase